MLLCNMLLWQHGIKPKEYYNKRCQHDSQDKNDLYGACSVPSSEDAQKLQVAEAANRELQQKVEQLERDAAERRRLHNEDVRALQGELLSQAQELIP